MKIHGKESAAEHLSTAGWYDSLVVRISIVNFAGLLSWLALCQGSYFATLGKTFEESYL